MCSYDPMHIAKVVCGQERPAGGAKSGPECPCIDYHFAGIPVNGGPQASESAKGGYQNGRDVELARQANGRCGLWKSLVEV